MIKARLEVAVKEIEQAKIKEFHDKTFVNDDLQSTYEALENYIFEYNGDDKSSGDGVKELSNVEGIEIEMTDGVPEADDPPTEAVAASKDAPATTEADKLAR